MLEGDGVNLVLLEKERLLNLKFWLNDPRSTMLRRAFSQVTIAELEKIYARRGDEDWWLIESKRGSLVGFALNRPRDDYQIIEYLLAPDEGDEAHGVGAVRTLVEYLFLNYSIVRIQGEVLSEDSCGVSVFESNGFIREGVTRKSVFHGGEWKDSVIYGLLREDWTGPYFGR
jgi:RimJ/RimL family protein N-acetyltransferase